MSGWKPTIGLVHPTPPPHPQSICVFRNFLIFSVYSTYILFVYRLRSQTKWHTMRMRIPQIITFDLFFTSSLILHNVIPGGIKCRLWPSLRTHMIRSMSNHITCMIVWGRSKFNIRLDGSSVSLASLFCIYRSSRVACLPHYLINSTGQKWSPLCAWAIFFAL